MNNITNSPGGKPPRTSFRLDKSNGKIFGVCAGIGDYFGIDTMLVRFGFVAAALLGFGAPVLIYIAIALIAD
jgi:phage shock protein PspC (stress-responsive transcriptional regulator)